MKRLVVLLAAAVVSFCSTGNASITNASWSSDGDGVIVCTSGWDTGGLWMDGIQYTDPDGPAGHMLGTVKTDSPSDPTLTLSGTIDNQTGNAWLGYQINVIMSIPFTLFPAPNVMAPADWYVVPGYGVSGPVGGSYTGTMFFTGPSPIMTGGSLDFLYSITFGNTMGFSFTQEMIPWFTAIPEPSGLVLAGIGGLMLVVRLRRNRRA